MRPQAALGATEGSQKKLRPLYDTDLLVAAAGFYISAAPEWFIAVLADGGPSPWDAACARVGPARSG